jgi:septal ring factor EnvC (AmiA/AmiB activator)
MLVGVLLALLLMPGSLQAQEREKLEERRKQLLRDIELTSDLLAETQQNRAATMEHFLTLQKQIQKRQELIETLQSEITLAEQGIATAHDINDALQSDLDRLLEEYRNDRPGRSSTKNKQISHLIRFFGTDHERGVPSVAIYPAI